MSELEALKRELIEQNERIVRLENPEPKPEMVRGSVQSATEAVALNGMFTDPQQIQAMREAAAPTPVTTKELQEDVEAFRRK